MAGTKNHSKDIENGVPIRYNSAISETNRKGNSRYLLTRLIENVTLFISQSVTKFYNISELLAKVEIGIFAISTYNTDYILTKEADYDRALQTLTKNGYEISGSS